MNEAPVSGSRGAALVLAAAGLLTVIASTWTWGTCSTTPCGGSLMAFSWYSGLDLGFGYVTAVAGLYMAAIGVDVFRRDGIARFARVAAGLAILVILTVGATVLWMYVIPGDDSYYRWPPWTAFLVGIVGFVALAASLRLERRPALRAPRVDRGR